MSVGGINATDIANFLGGSTSTVSYFVVGGNGLSNNVTATIYSNAVVNVTTANAALAYSTITNSVNTLNISGGLLSGSTFTFGAGTASTNNLNTLNLGSGSVVLSSSLTTGTPGLGTNSTNIFNWTGGTLSVGTIQATNGAGSGWAAGGTASSISNNTLYNTNAGTLLVGNSTNGYAGKTLIQGSYNQNGSATTTFNVF
jgi:hypothetical protein